MTTMTQEPKMDDEPVTYGINIGGLMRCCLDRSLDAEDPKHRWPRDPREGDRLACPHGCGSEIIFHDGVMEWYRPDHPARTEGETS